MVAYSVFYIICIVGVRGAVHFFQVVIVVGVLVLVPHNESDGASGGLALEDAGKEFHLVGFFAYRRQRQMCIRDR